MLKKKHLCIYMQGSNIKRTLNGSVADNEQVCSYLRKIVGQSALVSKH